MAATWTDLLHHVQMSGIYPDSKTFVDKPLKFPEEEILQKLRNFNTSNELLAFIDENFDKEGEELIASTPSGFTENPKFLDSIKDDNYREFAKDLNIKWKSLGRKMKDEVRDSPDRFSLLYVPEPFVVPGGRFREFYYWDSYWAIQGMLICEMHPAVKSMLENLLYLVNRYGFIPNGGRKYYLNRSQPPLLIPMVHSYLEATNDLEFLKDNIHILEKEFEFWLENRTILVTAESQTYKYFQYNVQTNSPRPESYREDVETALELPPERRIGLYADLASAAESGWDFSTRWYDVNREHRLSSTATRQVVPVDLNAILCWNSRLLMEFHQKLGNDGKVTEYKDKFKQLKKQLDLLFYDKEKGAWFDHHVHTASKDTRFFASMVVPLFVSGDDSTDMEREDKVQRFLQYITTEFTQFSSYASGVPTSLASNSGQQWDHPNAWPPLQHMWIRAFQKSTNVSAQNFARELAEKWVRSNWKAWKPEHNMYEKYNAVNGSTGHGGEYNVQVGFGWTNGVILDLLALYPDLKSTED